MVARRKILSVLLVSIILSAAITHSCGNKGPDKGIPERSQEQPAAQGDTLIAAFAADPQSLNFVTASDVISNTIARLVTDSLVYHDRDLNIIPKIARSWEISDDRKTVTFHLRKDAAWHDGVPVTSNDVRFTFEKIMDPSSLAKDKIGMFRNVEEIRTPDPSTFIVKYREPSATALASWDINLIPEHIFLKEPDFLKSEYNAQPIGCGPFRFVKWERAQKIVLEANREYWGEKPYLDRVIFKIIPSEQVRFSALLAGDIDYTVLPPLTYQKETDRSEFKTRLRTMIYYPTYLWYISWNMDGSNPFFTDRRVRQAMTCAMDREGFLKNVYFGLGKVAVTDFQPGTWAFNARLQPHPYDLEKAKRLLDDAGWKDTNGNGTRDKDGIEFEFTLNFPAGPETSEQMASLFKEGLEKIGVKMSLIKLEWSTFMERKRNHTFQASMSGFRKDIDPDPYDIYHSSQYLNGSNYGKYANPEADRLLEEGRREFDIEKRKRIYERLQEVLHEDQPFTYLFHPAACVGIDRRFRNVEVSAAGIWQFFPGILSWWVPVEEQRYRN